MAFRVERDAALCEAKAIARAELARRRRRLGELTREQEMSVEKLIMSTVTKVLEVAGTALDSLPLVHATDANRQQQIRRSYCRRSISDASRYCSKSCVSVPNDR